MRIRLAAVAVLAIALAACSRNPGPSAIPSVPSSSVVPTPSETVVAEPAGSLGIMTCHDSFTSVSPLTLDQITTLQDAGRDLDATIEHCGSVAEWKTGAQAVLPTIDLSDTETFLRDRCTANSELTDTALCQSLGG